MIAPPANSFNVPLRAAAPVLGVKCECRFKAGWSMSATMAADVVTNARMMGARRRCRPSELMLHTDRGSSHTSAQCLRLLVRSGIRCSLSRVGNDWDSVAMATFLSALETGRTGGTVHRSRGGARAEVTNSVGRSDEPGRRHSTLAHLGRVTVGE